MELISNIPYLQSNYTRLQSNLTPQTLVQPPCEYTLHVNFESQRALQLNKIHSPCHLSPHCPILSTQTHVLICTTSRKHYHQMLSGWGAWFVAIWKKGQEGCNECPSTAKCDMELWSQGAWVAHLPQLSPHQWHHCWQHIWLTLQVPV